MTLSTLTGISRWNFKRARPVNLSSLIRDLVQDLSLRSVEKPLFALAVLTGKVKSMLKNT
jgi:hypothetical protein